MLVALDVSIGQWANFGTTKQTETEVWSAKDIVTLKRMSGKDGIISVRTTANCTRNDLTGLLS